jgi:hypothetical protein
MRLVSLGLCTVFALSCGDADQSQIDPNFLNGARPGAGSGANGRPGADGDGAMPDEGEPSAGDEDVATTTPELSACAEAPAAEKACSAPSPGDNAASTETVPPPGGGGSGGDDGVGSAGSGGPGDSPKGNAGAGGADDGGSAGGDDGAAGSGAGASGGSGEPEALPDLIVDGAYLMATIQQDVVDASADLCLFNEGCVTGEGPRRVVRFGTRSANVGAADVVVGEPVAGNPLWEFDVCHEHFHFEGYARYDLVEASSGVVLPIGNKNGFCLRDLDNWSNPSCATYDCDYQGISAGCADVYTPDLDCQWVDITDVAPGTYDLVVTVNTERSIREQSFDNNSVTVTIEILPETVRVVP